MKRGATLNTICPHCKREFKTKPIVFAYRDPKTDSIVAADICTSCNNGILIPINAPTKSYPLDAGGAGLKGVHWEELEE